MKIIIITDLEGVAGVVDFETQALSGSKYYETAKELATEEVNATCEACIEKDVDEILVIDGHGPGGIIPEKIHKEVKLLHGRPVPTFWELDKKWDGLILLGYHSMNGTEKGNLNHTYTLEIVNMWLNGEKIGEIGMKIYLAGWFGIPTILISGDEAAVKEAEKYVSNIEKCIVKWGITKTSAISLSPLKAREIIKDKTKRALERIKEIKPVKLEGKCEIVIEYLSTADAFNRGEKSDAELIEPTKVRIKGENFIDVWKKFYRG
ncbi:MAG TPA: M55 family metallopeptidase [bacterium]|nr:M55 family metallopeptidase [bacterium]HOM27411.1 M55 family metallopeptidase [bacterium]